MTLTASPTCAAVRDQITGRLVPLPDSVRERTYQVELTQQDSSVSIAMVVTDADKKYPVTIPGSVNGTQLSFSNYNPLATCGEDFADEFSPFRVFRVVREGIRSR